MIQSINTQRHALNWARLGFHVFPLPRGRKAPPPKGWQQMATRNPEEVKRLFPAGRNLNIGAVPGKGGMAVIDVDGPEGIEAARAFFGGKPPLTIAWRTGRDEGGVHLCYTLPEGVRVRSRRIGSELDVKSDGGYVLLPPSLHPSGRVYASVDNGAFKPAELSQQIAQALVYAAGPGRSDENAPDPERLLAPGLAKLREVVAAIPNDDTWDRDRYIRMGAAIKAAAGPEHEAEAFEIWLEWAKRWTEGVNEEETLERDWKGLHPPFAIGWDWIADWARAYGTPDPSDSFSAFVEQEKTAEQLKRENLGLWNVYDMVTDPDLTADPPVELPHLGWRGRLTFFWGAEKSGKSTTCRAFALDPLAEGKRVLWFDFEEGVGQWALGSSKMEALAPVLKERYDETGEWTFYYHYQPESWKHVQALLDFVQPDIVIVDSLTSSITVLEGERPDNSDSSAWMNHMKAWKRLTTDEDGEPLRAIIMLGHAIRDASRYAGSHGIGAGVDIKIGLRELKSGNRKLFADGGRAGLVFQDKILKLQSDGSILALTRDQQTSEEEGQVLEYVATNPQCSRSEIADALLLHRDRVVSPIVSDLLDKDILVEPIRGRLEVAFQNTMDGFVEPTEEEG